MTRACDVCMILDGDETPKEVRYCSGCGKYICQGCRYSPRRVKAALKTAVKTFGNMTLGGAQ